MIGSTVRAGTAAPAAVRFSVLGWLAAIAAGVAEVLVRLALPEPPTPAELGVRGALYVALAALVLALRSGRNAVRWAVTVVLGGVGLLSLVAEPVGWWLAGGSVTAFLAAADGPTVLVVALRVLHVGAVLAALVALYTPSANAFFRAAGR
jgi:hypothetical protein